MSCQMEIFTFGCEAEGLFFCRCSATTSMESSGCISSAVVPWPNKCSYSAIRLDSVSTSFCIPSAYMVREEVLCADTDSVVCGVRGAPFLGLPSGPLIWYRIRIPFTITSAKSFASAFCVDFTFCWQPNDIFNAKKPVAINLLARKTCPFIVPIGYCALRC